MFPPASDSEDGLVISATATKIVFGKDFDFSSCYKEILGSSIKSMSARAKIFFQIECTGFDLTKYDGKTFKEAEDDDDFEENCTTGGTLTNTKFTSKYSYEYGGQLISTEKTSIYYSGDANMNICENTANGETWDIEDNCIDTSSGVYKNTTLDGGQVSVDNDLMKFVFTGLTASKGDTARWYRSGTANVTINDWTGTLEYTAADAAPTYSFTDGSDTSTGTLSLTGFKSMKARLFSKVKESLPSIR